MPRIMMFNRVTADGYFAAADGGLGWAVPDEEIAAMKSRPGNDMILFGSGSIVSQLTAHRLVDEYQLVVSPVFLGGGRSLVTSLPESVRLELLEAKPYPSGNVKLRYLPAT